MVLWQGIVENVGDIFVEMFSGNQFDVYEQFCANQLPASELYTALKAKSPEFVKVMNSCVGNTQESRGFDLPAFLLKGTYERLSHQHLVKPLMREDPLTGSVTPCSPSPPVTGRDEFCSTHYPTSI